jgi:hypothetical protein
MNNLRFAGNLDGYLYSQFQLLNGKLQGSQGLTQLFYSIEDNITHGDIQRV